MFVSLSVCFTHCVPGSWLWTGLVTPLGVGVERVWQAVVSGKCGISKIQNEGTFTYNEETHLHLACCFSLPGMHWISRFSILIVVVAAASAAVVVVVVVALFASWYKHHKPSSWPQLVGLPWLNNVGLKLSLIIMICSGLSKFQSPRTAFQGLIYQCTMIGRQWSIEFHPSWMKLLLSLD